MKLTTHQKDMLKQAARTGVMKAGRNGWNTAHVKRLEAMGLVTLSRKGVYCSSYALTKTGAELAQ